MKLLAETKSKDSIKSRQFPYLEMIFDAPHVAQVEFAARHCPSVDAPNELGVKKYLPKHPMSRQAPTLFLPNGAGNSIDRFQARFIKVGNVWESINANEYYENIFGTFHIDIPTRLQLESYSIDPYQPNGIPLSVYFNGKVVAEVSPKYASRKGLDSGEIPQKARDQMEKLMRNSHIPILINRESVGDPESWTRTVLSKDIRERVSKQFIRSFPKVRDCSEQGATTNIPTTNKDILIADRIFRSKSNSILVGVAWRKACYPGETIGEFAHWYSVKDAKIKEISKNEWLLPRDAGDFDGDGKSEWIFSTFRDSQPYVLFQIE